jgi:hypothetical protein
VFVAIGKNVHFILFIAGNSIRTGMAKSDGKLCTRQGHDLKRKLGFSRKFMAEVKENTRQCQRQEHTLG